MTDRRCIEIIFAAPIPSVPHRLSGPVELGDRDRRGLPDVAALAAGYVFMTRIGPILADTRPASPPSPPACPAPPPPVSSQPAMQTPPATSEPAAPSVPLPSRNGSPTRDQAGTSVPPIQSPPACRRGADTRGATACATITRPLVVPPHRRSPSAGGGAHAHSHRPGTGCHPHTARMPRDRGRGQRRSCRRHRHAAAIASGNTSSPLPPVVTPMSDLPQARPTQPPPAAMPTQAHFRSATADHHPTYGPNASRSGAPGRRRARTDTAKIEQAVRCAATTPGGASPGTASRRRYDLAAAGTHAINDRWTLSNSLRHRAELTVATAIRKDRLAFENWFAGRLPPAINACRTDFNAPARTARIYPWLPSRPVSCVHPRTPTRIPHARADQPAFNPQHESNSAERGSE